MKAGPLLIFKTALFEIISPISFDIFIKYVDPFSLDFGFINFSELTPSSLLILRSSPLNNSLVSFLYQDILFSNGNEINLQEKIASSPSLIEMFSILEIILGISN
jgi:hypothetical protein